MYHGGRLGGMTRAEAIRFLANNPTRWVRGRMDAVYGWDSERGIVGADGRLAAMDYYFDGYEPVIEEPSLPVNFPDNWERVETREEAEPMGGGKVAFWSMIAQHVMAEQAFLLSGGNFYVRVKR